MAIASSTDHHRPLATAPPGWAGRPLDDGHEARPSPPGYADRDQDRRMWPVARGDRAPRTRRSAPPRHGRPPARARSPGPTTVPGSAHCPGWGARSRSTRRTDSAPSIRASTTTSTVTTTAGRSSGRSRPARRARPPRSPGAGRPFGGLLGFAAPRFPLARLLALLGHGIRLNHGSHRNSHYDLKASGLHRCTCWTTNGQRIGGRCTGAVLSPGSLRRRRSDSRPPEREQIVTCFTWNCGNRTVTAFRLCGPDDSQVLH